MIKKRQLVAVVPEPRNSLSFGFKDVRDISYVKAKNPSGLTKLLVLRATGNNHAFLGYRDGSVFQVLFIEYKFGDIYNHG